MIRQLIFVLLALNLSAGVSHAADEKRLFQCSEIDHILTPVDAVFETPNGYVIRRYGPGGGLVGTLQLAREAVDVIKTEQMLTFNSKPSIEPVFVRITVRGYASSLVIRSPEINVNKPGGGGLSCYF